MARARFAGSQDSAPIALRARLHGGAVQVDPGRPPRTVVLDRAIDGAPGPVFGVAPAPALASRGGLVLAVVREPATDGTGAPILVAIVAAVGGPLVLTPGEPVAYLLPASTPA